MSYANEVNRKFLNSDDDYIHPKDMSLVALRLETTNVCNHACRFCPNRKLRRKRRFIEPDLARRVIDEAYEMGVRKGGFFIMGEPLLNDDTLKCYAYAARGGTRHSFSPQMGR